MPASQAITPQPVPHAALQNIVALNSSFSHVATIVRPAVRTAPAVGAVIVASILLFHSIIRRVGRWLFLGVVLFDVALHCLWPIHLIADVHGGADAP